MPGTPPHHPEGIQRLLLGAKQEPHLADLLLADPAAAARYAGVELTDAELAVLAAIDGAQLKTMLDALPGAGDVPPTEDDPAVNTGGILADEPPPMVCQGIAPDEPPPIPRGHRADIPSRLWSWLRRR